MFVKWEKKEEETFVGYDSFWEKAVDEISF